MPVGGFSFYPIFVAEKPKATLHNWPFLLSLCSLRHHPRQLLPYLFEAKLSLFMGCAVNPVVAIALVRLVHLLEFTNFLRQEADAFRDVLIVHAEMITLSCGISVWFSRHWNMKRN